MATISADATAAAISAAKAKWEAAKKSGDQAGMTQAHVDAEAVRATVGFSGGADGSKYVALDAVPVTVAQPAAPALPNFGPAPAALSAAQLGQAASTASSATSATLLKEIQQIRDAYATKTTMPSTAALPTVSDNSTDIEKLYQAQQEARISALGKARDTSMSALQGEQSAIAPKYEQGRNAAGSASEIQARNFAEYLTNRGLAAGAGAQMEISRQGALQSQVGDLNQQEIASNADIERRRSGVTSGYESDAATAKAEIQAQQTAAVIQERNRVYESNYRRAVDIYGMESQQAQQAYQQMRDAMGDTLQVDQIAYGRGRDAVSDARASNQDEYARWQNENAMALQQYTLQYQAGRDTVGDTQWQTQYNQGVTESNRTFDLQKQTTEANLAANALDMQIKQAQLELQTDPNSPDNKIKALQLASAQQQLEEAKVLAQYAPAEAAARIAQIKAATSASWASTANMRADNTRQDDSAAYQMFLSKWEGQGYAPPNSFGVKEGTVYAPGVKQATAPKSADLLSLRDDFNKAIMGVEQPIYDSTGEKVGVSQVQKMTADIALLQIQQMEASGQITEAEAEQLALSIPAVNALMQAKLGKTNNQTRY